jgi:hypothetical protein
MRLNAARTFRLLVFHRKSSKATFRQSLQAALSASEAASLLQRNEAYSSSSALRCILCAAVPFVKPKTAYFGQIAHLRKPARHDKMLSLLSNERRPLHEGFTGRFFAPHAK